MYQQCELDWIRYVILDVSWCIILAIPFLIQPWAAQIAVLFIPWGVQNIIDNGLVVATLLRDLELTWRP